MDVIADVIEDHEAAAALSPTVLAEVVADKGYHSNEVLERHAELGIRTYISEPRHGKRRWNKKQQAQAAVYANRRRMRGQRGKRLSRRRGEFVERAFAHCLDTGGMRRVHLRGHANIRKQAIVHAAAFNLGLVMRQLVGVGTPRELAALWQRFLRQFATLNRRLLTAASSLLANLSSLAVSHRVASRASVHYVRSEFVTCAPGC